MRRRAVIKPRRLAPGDTVALVSPATATFQSIDVQIAKESLEALGLKVRLGEHLLDRHGYLAGEDKARAADINAVCRSRRWRRSTRSAAAGEAPAPALPGFRRDSAQPEDRASATATSRRCCSSIHAKTGLVTFHGPIGIGRWDTYSVDYYRRVLFNGELVTYANKHELSDRNSLTQVEFRTQTIMPGKARGRLLGGNLTVLTGILGSPYVPDWDGAILFCEDVHEERIASIA